MSNPRTIARLAGILYIIGTAAGILSVVCTGAMRESTDVLTKISSNENQVLLGTLLLLIMGISLAFIPIIVYPILKKFSESLAIGYVVFRGALETFTYLVTAISWIYLVVLSREYVNSASPDSSFLTLSNLLGDAGELLQSITMIIFSLGALIFYYVLYRSNLIPKWLSGWGLLGGLLYLATGILALFGETYTIALAPLGLQEMVMALWLIIKGFNRRALA